MPERATLGRVAGDRHFLPLRVHWEDTDASGIVYYANYLRFIERARSDLLRLAGISQQSLLVEEAVALTVRSCNIEYFRPARLDDEIEVQSALVGLKGASLTVRQSVFRGPEELVRADVRIACITRGGRPCRLPDSIRRALAVISPSSPST